MYRFVPIRIVFSLVIFILTASSFFSCGKTDVTKAVEYTGPLSEAENVEMYYSENERVKIKMVADVVYEYKTGDREFPKGIYLEFYNEFGRLESTLRANQAYFFKSENKWRGEGKVEVKNIEKNEQLNTEELFWKPAEEKIFTDKFVTVRQQGTIIYGTGLEAKQDMSTYLFKKVEGELEVEE